MTRMIRLLAVSAVALGLTACGGGAKLGGDKEGAAQAAFQASQPAGRGHTKSGQALIDQALASGAVSITLSADCAESGKVHLTLDAGAAPKLGTFSYVVRYDACSEDGENEYTGEVTTTVVAGFDLDGNIKIGGFYIAMKGKLTIEGEISDFIETDVRLGMEIAATSKRSGSVQLVVDGTIKTSTGSFTYSKEVLVTAAGRLPRA
ncbi:hypothetical protein D187_006408 [Cystobacter fuscus DSM 2262]|uniref:Lipoprotein n=1 Tax=Cystobacter fuscus (strain ATCC 25194 / DSM 2262 / NBRC 100088 / M29) TaxID=1242864 RepID=S9R259_CYSF2|nr:hypothetical protein [Cystobacter fuscus]EPX62998.1 hypothetical protein D187_006408 [Cystobacter fuscus DSM 2262]